jgi:hypothetical protein
MKAAIHDASARQHSGRPSPVRGRGGDRNDRARKPGLVEVEAEVAGLLDRSTQELRLVRQPHTALTRSAGDGINAGLYGSAQGRLGGGTSGSNPASSSGESANFRSLSRSEIAERNVISADEEWADHCHLCGEDQKQFENGALD